ncbi:MAG: mechanosensitive ion channel family protein [Candidatus Zixiibacteriota bacterium]|nr:MAG: mechanosensitive ion channel family protein [candidate division Zixibacteria bacterium]
MLLLEETWIQIFKALAVFAAVLAGGLILRGLILRWISRLSARTSTQIDDVLIHTIKGPSLLWFAILGLNMGSRVLLQDQPTAQLWVDRFSLVIWIISLTWAASRFLGEAINVYGTKLGGALMVTSLTRNIARITVIIIGGLFILQTFGISIAPVITALGVGGLAVALALQDTLSNLFAGMYLMMAQQVRVGDYVKLDSGEEGFVTDITWRTTTIRALANNAILVPNNKLSQAIITNYYLPETRMSLLINVGVSYDSDPEQIEKILVEETLATADLVPGLLKEPAPFVRFIPGFGDSSLDFTLICQVREFTDQYLSQHEIRKRIFKRFKAEGIEIPFPQRTLHLPGGAQVRVEKDSHSPE